MTQLIILQQVGVFTLIRRWLVTKAGRFIYKLYSHYYLTNVHGYEFHENRMNEAAIRNADLYVNEGAIFFYKKEMLNNDISKLSQFYPYAKIDEGGETGLRICNVGCFYAGADAFFLKRHPGAVVYGLDFGKIFEINSDLHCPDLKLFAGYPLDILEKFSQEKDFVKFDYTLFIRTATKINIEQLLSYMDVLSKLSKNICFLEVAKLSTSHLRRVDINNIDMMNPMKLYGGMYLHNYPKLLERHGYKIVTSEILPASTFPKQSLTPDHDFVYIHGRQ